MDEVTKAINHFSALMEEQNSKLDAVLEYVSEMPQVVNRLDRLENKVDKLEQDMTVVKTAVTATNRDLAAHVRQPSHIVRSRPAF